jgi:uncharacterized protein YktB (UPF0637 family)
MTFQGFTQTDFDVFNVPGLSAICGQEMYPHVARHARRKIHPPIDTWVAWSGNKKGYKAHPHFQLGLFSTHLFIQFAIIYESGNKETFAGQLVKKVKLIKKTIPKHYVWSMDHMKPEGKLHKEMSDSDFLHMSEKLIKQKKAEVLCGIRIDRHLPLLSDGEQLFLLIKQTFDTVLPLYELSFQSISADHSKHMLTM